MSLYFLFCGLFFPRLTLLYCLLADTMPANNTPYLLDAVAAVFAPRLLIGFWAHDNGEAWFWPAAYLIAFGLAFSGGATTSEKTRQSSGSSSGPYLGRRR